MENMFAKNLDYLLKTKKTTPQKLLKITGHSSKSLVSMWKSGERTITTGDAVLIANHIGCTVDDLINQDLEEIQNQYDELTDMFIMHNMLLTDDDKDTIKFIIEKRVKENERKNN